MNVSIEYTNRGEIREKTEKEDYNRSWQSHLRKTVYFI